MSDYQCPGRDMPQPADAPFEGYVACYRAGHHCPMSKATVKEDENGRGVTYNCPCCGDFKGAFYIPTSMLTPGVGGD